MGGLVKFPKKTYTQRIGNDSIYGMGVDGDVVISSNTSLSKDMYYNNLTINSGAHLNTNGFRVFVRGTLALNGSIGVKTGTAVSTGTVSGTAAAATSVTYSIGGAGYGTTASQIPATLLNNIQSAISGRLVDVSGSLLGISGGSGGTAGANGTVTPGTDSPATWLNSAGQAGALGQHPPHAHQETPVTPGGRGGHGSPGTRGALASPGNAGVGGVGGTGGPVVLIAAKTVTGSGIVFSQGTAGGSKQAKTEPGAMHAGSAGAAGANAPARDGGTVHVYTYNHSRPAHHGGGDSHTTPLPTGHWPSGWAWAPAGPWHDGHLAPTVPGRPTYSWHKSDRYTYNEHHEYSFFEPTFHAYITNGHGGEQENFHASPSYFRAIGGVDHNHFGNPSSTGGAPAGSYAHLFLYHDASWSGGHYHHTPVTHQSTDYSSHHSAPRAHDIDLLRTAGTIAHNFSYSFHYPGGAGGAGGAAGPAGTAGSTTEGTDGNPGGGGGIIFITETTPSVTMNTGGGSSNSNTGAAGMQVILLNG